MMSMHTTWVLLISQRGHPRAGIIDFPVGCTGWADAHRPPVGWSRPVFGGFDARFAVTLLPRRQRCPRGHARDLHCAARG
jgi:hypothetical protein